MMEIRRMRSHVEFKPGEIRGCVGCHETKQHVPRAGGARWPCGASPRSPSRRPGATSRWSTTRS